MSGPSSFLKFAPLAYSWGADINLSRGESSKESELSIQSGVSFGEQLMEQYVKKDRQKSRITL